MTMCRGVESLPRRLSARRDVPLPSTTPMRVVWLLVMLVASLVMMVWLWLVVVVGGPRPGMRRKTTWRLGWRYLRSR